MQRISKTYCWIGQPPSRWIQELRTWAQRFLTILRSMKSLYETLPALALILFSPSSVQFSPGPSRPTLDPWVQGRVVATDIVMTMLNAVLEGDSQKLETLLMNHPNHINLPIGLPFDVHGGRFFNHPSMNQCVILQHPDQTIFDIACGLPSGPVIWVLLAHGAKGSKHPLGTDLAFHNAIKNGRVYTVQALLMPGRSNIHGEPGTTWRPLLQAVYWNQADVVRLLIDRGANVNETSPWVDEKLKSTLEHCLERRLRDYFNEPVRQNCDRILNMLLNAGTDIHLRPAGEASPLPFELFIKPWQGDPHWPSKLSPMEWDCLEAFIRKGADLKTPFKGFKCGAASTETFEHQVLWHTTPTMARMLIDHACPNPDGNGRSLLHEIAGSCPDAKRHPADTLRDIDVLLKRGADPNLYDSSGFTPLRRCIERCPAVDIATRLKLLLDGGADPELKQSNRLPAYVVAARTFGEPLRSQVMDFLVAKLKGRLNRVVYDETFTWSDSYFPIPHEPTFAQVQVYNGQDAGFNANVEQMLQEDVRNVFQRACFSVASMNFLNAQTMRAKMAQPLQLTVGERDEIYQVVAQRERLGLPEYRFDQYFVMGLLKPQMAPVLANASNVLDNSSSPSSEQDDFLRPHQTPIFSSAPTASGMTANSSLQIDSENQGRRSSTSSDGSSASFLIPTTTLLRWVDIDRPSKVSDLKKVKEAVLRHTCPECDTGNLLTKAELERHKVEHDHSSGCMDESCRRRFCASRK